MQRTFKSTKSQSELLPSNIFGSGGYKLKQMNKVKTAIVGCGGISDIFFRNFTDRFEIIDLVKCCSRGKASADKKAQQYGIESSTLDDILADPEIELIVNLTPPGEHYSVIKAALEAGKHVFTEKTITTDVDHTKELIELAKEKGLYFGCEPDHFLGSSWQCAREYIDGGIIGDVTSAVVSVSQNYGAVAERIRFASQKGGGPGYDFGIYLVTQLVCLLGPAKEVCGVMMTQKPERIHGDLKHPDFGKSYIYTNEDLATASIIFDSGAVAVIHISGNSILEGPSPFLIYGTTGVLSLPLGATFSGDMQLYRPGSFQPVTVLPAHGFDHDSRGAGAAELAWALRLGRKPRAGADLGLHCQEILYGIEQSFKTRSFYQMTTSVSRPSPLPKGHRGLPGFCFPEESSLVL